MILEDEVRKFQDGLQKPSFSCIPLLTQFQAKYLFLDWEMRTSTNN